jgi:ATP sulfurylase
MDKLKNFLNPVGGNESRKVVISKRFQDDDGNPIPFVIKVISAEKNTELRRKATSRRRGRTGDWVETFDKERYAASLVVETTVYPDFRDEELCRGYGTTDPLELPGKMLTAGEYSALNEAIVDINGFLVPEELEDEAKNSSRADT